ncbi:MAG: high frequency lysogenization protein HflD [Gammaproteobacteria bacterium]|nr:high frequency lysogenization protein HflD [Gammaproteobacteria bacterium]
MSYQEQIIALAGMFQAGCLVRQIAREGRCEQAAYEASLRSLLDLNAVSTEAVYGGLEGVRLGLDVLSTLYKAETKIRDLEVSQYVLAIAHLEKKLAKQPKLLSAISNGIERAQAQAESFSPTHENVIANLAGIYTDTISTIPPRIVVSGEQGYLNNTENANKVRALLLALMRSAILWKQKGGRRWHVLLKRGKIMAAAKNLLKQTEVN